MIYHDFQGLKLSALGFGTMRLPVLEDGSVNEPLAAEMVHYAMDHGVNYFDTAYPYHGGMSEVVVGKALADYPRDSFYLATKYPGHQILSDGYNPAEIFEEQLVKCGVDHFDFYLLHNVNEKSMEVYMDPHWGIVDYFKEQKRLGRIRHLGFSSHAQVEGLEKFLDHCGQDMEFCQIQLNYMDWTLQRAREKYELLTARGIPVWVMEPVRGGKLAALDADSQQRLRAIRPGASAASFALRWLEGHGNIRMILSGMSTMAQVQDNIATFEKDDPVTPEEEAILLAAAEKMKNSVPCTACRYCCDGCPRGLDIPDLLHKYNQLRAGSGSTIKMQLDAVPKDKWPHACLGCGVCAAVCPQKIAIPDELAAFAAQLDKLPTWVEVCRQRAEAEARERASRGRRE